MENEIFKPAIYIHKDGTIEDLSDRIEISNLGRVYHIEKKILLKIRYKSGYPFVKVCKTDYFIHRLIMSTFQPKSETYECINHKDEIKTNSVLSNLEWCSRHYNNTYNNKIKKSAEKYKGSKCPKLWVAVCQFDKDMNYIKTFKSVTDAAISLGVNHSHISRCCSGKKKSAYGYIWKYASNCDHIS